MDCSFKFLGIVSVLALLFYSCTDIVPERVRPVDEHEVRVEFSACPSLPDTRAGIDEVMIKNVIVCIFDKYGELCGNLSLSGTNPGYIKLVSGKTYNVYAVANIDDFTPSEIEQELVKMRYAIKYNTDFTSQGLPMSSFQEVYIGGNNVKVSLLMERMVAKISFAVESSSMPGFKVESVRLMNAPKNMLIFQKNSTSSVYNEGDSASAEDISSVNSGGHAVFYMLENCQGVLLPDNDDPWNKVPDNLHYTKVGKCTYLEVTASLDGTSGVEGPVVYRFYLGQDMVSDFNVYRNTDSKVTLIVTEEGLDKVSWRIDSSNLKPLPIPIIAVGSSGIVCHTDMNGDIHSQTVGKTKWNSVLSAGNKYIAVGDGGYMAVSEDGAEWRTQVLQSINWKSVTYGNGIYVAVGNYERPVVGTEGQQRYFGYVATSSDAENWTLEVVDDHYLSDIVYMDGVFVATSEFREWHSYVSDWVLIVSKDARTWEKTSSGSRLYRNLLAGNNEFVAMDSGSYVYSVDGYSWSENTYGGIPNITDFVWDKKRKYVAVGLFGKAGYSSDCRTWTESSVSLSGNWRDVDYGAERFMAVGDLGAAMYSSDGKVWYGIDLGVKNNLYGVCIMR